MHRCGNSLLAIGVGVNKKIHLIIWLVTQGDVMHLHCSRYLGRTTWLPKLLLKPMFAVEAFPAVVHLQPGVWTGGRKEEFQASSRWSNQTADKG